MPTAAALESADPIDTTEERASRRPSKRTIVGAIVAVIVTIGGGYAIATRGHVSTDDAQVDADIVAVQAQIPGTVRQILFTENQHVTAGQVLVILDDTEYTARLAEARGNLAAAEASADAADADVSVVDTRARGDVSYANANLRVASAVAAGSGDELAEATAELARAQASATQAENDRRRMQALHDDHSIADSVFEQAVTASQVAASNVTAAEARLQTIRSNMAEARGQIAAASARLHQTSSADALIEQARAHAAEAHAEVDVARARLRLAEEALSHTRIVAPGTGLVSRRNVQIGQIVPIGHGVAQLVRESRWITANFKETQIENLRPGQPVAVSVDAFPGSTLWASVESFGGATGSRFTLLPPDNATGNYTKVVQRVPVRMRIGHVPDGVVLLPGMSVEVTVHTRRGGS